MGDTGRCPPPLASRVKWCVGSLTVVLRALLGVSAPKRGVQPTSYRLRPQSRPMDSAVQIVDAVELMS